MPGKRWQAAKRRHVWLWDIADPAHANATGKPLAGPPGPVESVAFSASGTVLAAGTADSSSGGPGSHAVWLWNVADPARPALFAGMPLTGPAQWASGVAFSPDGTILAASSQDKNVCLWKVRAPAAHPVFLNSRHRGGRTCRRGGHGRGWR